MKKKALIWSIAAIILIPIIAIVSFLSWMVLDARSLLKEQEKAAINFVEKNYEESCELVDARDVNFNAGFSEFYFYNKENDFYFTVTVTGSEEGKYEVYSSDYDEMFIGSIISQDIKEKFSDLEFIISTCIDNNGTHGYSYIKLLQDGTINEEKEYNFLKYITDNYENINIEYFLLEEKVYSYYKKAPLNHITANAGFNYESHIDLKYGEDLFEIKDASDFDYEMYLKFKNCD